MSGRDFDVKEYSNELYLGTSVYVIFCSMFDVIKQAQNIRYQNLGVKRGFVSASLI